MQPRFPDGFSRSDLLALLRPSHPRLLARAEDWERIQNSLPSSPCLRALRGALEGAAAEILLQPPAERVLTGRRLLDVSREVLRRVLVLAALHRLEAREPFLQRARAELLNAAAFPDWNPAHFLDTAEMTLALAIGYDWLHGELSAEDRAVLRGAIIEKGLEPGAAHHRWKQQDNNWNQVCFGGLVAGALAIGGHEPDRAAAQLREAFARNHLPLDACRPHGAYPEGPSYWSYGTHYQVILVSVLESALGTCWGLDRYPAFREGAEYINLMIGPGGQFFNYADASARVRPLPVLHWFASRASDPALDARERAALLARDPADLRDGGGEHRFCPLALLWLDPALEGRKPRQLPLHWRADGPNPLAVHRSSWEPDALFLAVKGGSPGVNHGHMDAGSFVLDWAGRRWALDLGKQEYESLERLALRIWERPQDSDRWRVFRMGTHSHNTLVVGAGQQRVGGFAPVRGFSPGPGTPFTEIDLTGVHAGCLTRAIRRAEPLPPDGARITDTLEGLAPGQPVRWGMVTPAEVSLEGGQATLRQEDRVMTVRIHEPAGAAWTIVPTDPPPGPFDAPNPGTRMLAFTAESPPSGRLRLRVEFAGQR